MRGIVAAFSVVAALLLIAASMAMNYTFWRGQGADEEMARVLGAASIGVDIFKAMLPLAIAWASEKRNRLAAAVATTFFVGCVVFSFVSAIGFAASSRGAVTAGREATMLRYEAADRELKDVRSRLANFAEARPEAVIAEAIGRAKQDRRWSSSKECSDATAESSRAFCKDVADLRIELASASETRNLREREAALKTENHRLLAAGARLDNDPQASLLARLSGLALEQVQTALVLLLALMVELGAAFGLFLAMIPLRTRTAAAAADHRGPGAVHSRPLSTAKALAAPTRFTRGPDGELMIE